RARVRAMAMWLTVGALCLGVFVLVYALLVGFDRERTAPVAAVAGEGRTVVVRYLGGPPGCGDPGRIEVRESAAEVELTAYVVVREATRYDRQCPAEEVPMLTTVRLDEPVGDRLVRDAARDGAEVPAVGSVRELTEPEG